MQELHFQDFYFKEINKKDAPVIIWAHGWGHSHDNWAQLITPLENMARHIAIDFNGFGASPPPPEHWGTIDYADNIAAWIKERGFAPVIWIGHSFGCRIGLQLAAKYPECVKSMCLISGAGLKRKRSIANKIYFYFRIKLFKILKKLIPKSAFKDKLMSKFGSADYKNASAAMRKIFVRVVNEDLSEIAAQVKCPTTLIYGRDDNETPPEFGERYSKLIKGAKLFILEGQDHYSVLQNGRHQVIKLIAEIIKEQS